MMEAYLEHVRQLAAGEGACAKSRASAGDGATGEQSCPRRGANRCPADATSAPSAELDAANQPLTSARLVAARSTGGSGNR
jgi:hypothetical protein